MADKKSFVVGADGRSIQCRLCGMTSHNPNDVEHRFCGQCGIFHDDVPELVKLNPATIRNSVLRRQIVMVQRALRDNRIDSARLDSVALRRIIDEVANGQASSSAYNRVYHRHNR